MAETEPRAKTAEEMQEEFLQHLAVMAHYWGTIQPADRKPMTALDRCNGLAFSVLSAIDGETLALPAINLVPSPHPNDEDYYRGEGENWYPSGVVINECELHEMWHKYEKK